jgi:broad specificity phosphatase PhoE
MTGVSRPTRVICIRHGQSAVNVDGRLSSQPPGSALTDVGRAQAIDVAQGLSDSAVVHVYTSPLRRAQETASIIADHLQVPVTVMPDLREFDLGAREGTPGTNNDVLTHTAFAGWVRGELLDASFEGGETGTELVNRLRLCLDAIADRHPNQTTVAVTHGGLMVAGLPNLCSDLPPARAGAAIPENCGTADLVRDDVWRCLSWPRGA